KDHVAKPKSTVQRGFQFIEMQVFAAQDSVDVGDGYLDFLPAGCSHGIQDSFVTCRAFHHALASHHFMLTGEMGQGAVSGEWRARSFRPFARASGWLRNPARRL